MLCLPRSITTTFAALTLLAAAMGSTHAQTPNEAAMRAQAEASMKQHYELRTASFSQDSSQRDIVMLGDSLVEGTDWAAYFPSVTSANRGIGGDTTQGMVSRLDSVLSLKPRKVFIMAGINDLSWYGWPVTDVYDRYKQMIGTLSRAKIKVYVQSTLFVGPAFPPAVNVSVADLNTRLRDYCKQGHCTFIDLNPTLAPGGALDLRYTVDHLHVNADGYASWAAVIAPFFKR